MAYTARFEGGGDGDFMDLIRKLYEAMGSGPGPQTRERLSVRGVPPGGNYAPGRRQAQAPGIMSNAAYPGGFPTVAEEVSPAWYEKMWDKMHGAQALTDAFTKGSAMRSQLGPPEKLVGSTPDARSGKAKKLIEKIRAEIFALEGDAESVTPEYTQEKWDEMGRITDSEMEERYPGGINAPYGNQYIRWSETSPPDRPEPDRTTDPISVLKALAGGGGTMSREDILTGNRPSDIMARQMYEQDKRKEAIMEMMTSDNPARREQGLQMLQAMQTMYETERQPAVDQFKQAIEQLQGQTAQTEAQAQMQEAIGKQMQAEAVAGGPMAEVEAQLYTMQKLLDTIAPDAPPEQRMRLLLGMMQSIFGIDPSLMGISLEE